jgi:hypothetical protein
MLEPRRMAMENLKCSIFPYPREGAKKIVAKSKK